MKKILVYLNIKEEFIMYKIIFYNSSTDSKIQALFDTCNMLKKALSILRQNNSKVLGISKY
jgi:hypothetical protein